jgi:hypothetical protein
MAFVLMACDGKSTAPIAVSIGESHVPEISEITFSPSSAGYMEGNGSIVVTATIAFRDAGQDVQTLAVQMGDSPILNVGGFATTATGTFSTNLILSTETVGMTSIQFWLVDRDGNSSIQESKTFRVFSEIQAGEWTQRLSGLPYALNDVVWDGEIFVAVGDDGVVLTSDDGIDWVERESSVDVNLNAVAAYGDSIVAVGYDDTILLSQNHGESWSIKRTGDRVYLAAVTINASRIVAGGYELHQGEAITLFSEDSGNTWAHADSWPADGHHLTDLVYHDGLYVGATDINSSTGDTRVWVSTDGRVWQDIVLRSTAAGLYAVGHVGNQFVVAGDYGLVSTSLDGYNWTIMQTPFEELSYQSISQSGSELLLAGGITWWYWWMGTPNFERPAGLSSTDGGITWDIFDIDGYYESRGMARGVDVLVSVGAMSPGSGEGAIYTTD